jgi:CHASE2 domain-containing sensor protein
MLHKHIARHTKKYVRHVTKYLYERDTLFATIAVFVFLIVLGSIPINFYVLNPMKTAMKDFDFNDMKFARLVEDDKIKLDTNIVIVNIGKSDREQIAGIINLVNEYKPKVIGLDALFVGDKDSTKDALLRETFINTKNLIAASYIEPADTFFVRKDYFDSSAQNKGYVNFVTETIGTRRFYSPFEMIEGKRVPSFTSAIVEKFDSAAYQKLASRHKQVETISYSRRDNKYFVVEPAQLIEDGVDTNTIRNRIVLLGYINKDPSDIEDKLFTPMNEKFAGKALPDMNGIVVHANIISMVLKGNYINKAPKWVAWVLAIVIGWIHMSLFIRYYLESHIWFHLVAKLAQVFSVIFFAYVGIFIFDKFDLKLEMKYTLYVIALAVDVIYFYEALVTWMHRKFKYQTIFGHHGHGAEHGTEHKQEHHNNEQHKHETTTHEHH